ncbi:MAG TPA: YbdK family carboxylate-amine ligase [Solirubrobacteraceae bacterium]|nr:YbdK family carboxylate-amine ligase [Solirubrobacteraceae bacterium]
MTHEPTIDRFPAALGAASLRAVFDSRRSFSVGLEEELMLLDPRTLDLAPCAREVLADLDGDMRFKPELPAAQIENVTVPRRTVGLAAEDLRTARRDLTAALDGRARVAAAAVHPFAAALGELNADGRFSALAQQFASSARRQLVVGLHVHVSVGGSDLAVAVHDALRSYLPEIAALAANGPFHEGRDSGLASVRPRIAAMLPRQGVPPALGSWGAFERALEWGASAGLMPDARRWWWELRLHPTFGTIEVRVADAQTTVGETAAVAAVVHALVTWLAQRVSGGEELAVSPTWRIAENSFVAARDGLDADLADLVSGEREPVRERLERLLDELAPVAAQLGCVAELEHARALAAGPGGAARQRADAQGANLEVLVAALADRLLA